MSMAAVRGHRNIIDMVERFANVNRLLAVSTPLASVSMYASICVHVCSLSVCGIHGLSSCSFYIEDTLHKWLQCWIAMSDTRCQCIVTSISIFIFSIQEDNATEYCSSKHLSRFLHHSPAIHQLCCCTMLFSVREMRMKMYWRECEDVLPIALMSIGLTRYGTVQYVCSVRTYCSYCACDEEMLIKNNKQDLQWNLFTFVDLRTLSIMSFKFYSSDASFHSNFNVKRIQAFDVRSGTTTSLNCWDSHRCWGESQRTEKCKGSVAQWSAV